MPDEATSGGYPESIEDRIVRIVRQDGPCTISDITEQVIYSERHTRRLLRQMADEGRIEIEENAGRHLYKP